jgi:hypothetical protein
MCQAYDAEHRTIVQSEGRYAIHGFVSALTGKPEACPGPAFKDEAKAWYHGYRCAKDDDHPLIPWAAVCALTRDTSARVAIERRFQRQRKLQPKEMAILKNEGWIINYEGAPPVPDPQEKRKPEPELGRPIAFSD